RARVERATHKAPGQRSRVDAWKRTERGLGCRIKRREIGRFLYHSRWESGWESGQQWLSTPHLELSLHRNAVTTGESTTTHRLYAKTPSFLLLSDANARKPFVEVQGDDEERLYRK
ncbi:2709_t:CDS:2, partial [Acaulospora colombiana]